MDILLCLYSDTGYFLAPPAEEGLTGRFARHAGRLYFRVEAPAALAGQLLCCHARGSKQFRFLAQITRHRARLRILGFSLGRCFYVTGASRMRSRSRSL
ncbi:MAG TPA: hypothetical protein DFH97_01280 [Clostridiales bacterium]|nr:hypothetical protein [Clostridiales bacterium]HCI63680.1 hypothetical protein [Clostridiales bacterium]